MMVERLMTMTVVVSLLLLLSLLLKGAAAASGDDTGAAACRTPQHWRDHPALCHWLERIVMARDDGDGDDDGVWRELHRHAHDSGLLVDLRPSKEKNVDDAKRMTEAAAATVPTTAKRQQRRRLGDQNNQQRLPVVLAHGMGDSCFNDGMQDAVRLIRSWLGNSTYVVCIPTGASRGEDTKNGYFLSMDANLEIFAQNIREDPQLASGFHAVGFSQGSNLIRGYVAKYNTPAVHTFLSVNGVNAGIGAVPYCRPSSAVSGDGAESSSSPPPPHTTTTTTNSTAAAATVKFSVCDLLMEQASHRAYTEFAQEHSFQANYWRDPRPSMRPKYQEFSQLAAWGNEVPAEKRNATLNANWARTRQFVWVLATEDGMVWPREGEQWGAPDGDADDPFASAVLPMNETEWYAEDLFGLRTADRAGKNHFESFAGDHLQFSREDLRRWVTTYLTV